MKYTDGKYTGSHLSPNMCSKNSLLGWPKKAENDRRIQIEVFKRDPTDATGFRRTAVHAAWWHDAPPDHEIEISIEGTIIYKTVRVRDIEWDSKAGVANV